MQAAGGGDAGANQNTEEDGVFLSDAALEKLRADKEEAAAEAAAGRRGRKLLSLANPRLSGAKNRAPAGQRPGDQAAAAAGRRDAPVGAHPPLQRGSRPGSRQDTSDIK